MKNEHAHFSELLMKALDESLTEKEKQQFTNYINTNAEYMQEWKEFSDLHSVTQNMTLKKPPEEVWDMYWNSIYNRMERGISWLLISFGTMLLLGFASYKFVQAIYINPDVPALIVVGITALFGGIFALTLSIIREKYYVRKSDPYKEIQR